MKKYLLIFMLFVCARLISQENDSLSFRRMFRSALTYSVKTSSGTVYVGKIVEESRNFITIEEQNSQQRIELKKDQIVFFRPLSDREVYDGTTSPYAHAGLYMVSASSILYDKPTASVHYQWFLFDNINFSVNRHWDVTLNTIAVYPASIGLKCAYEIGKDTYLGANAFVAGSVSNHLVSNYIVGYGALGRLSRGVANRNFSVSGGVLGLNSELFGNKQRVPFLNLPFGSFAFCNRFKENWAFTAEGFYFPQINSGFGGIGVKYFKGRDNAWTFGCFTVVNAVNNYFSLGTKAIPIPFISYSTNFF